MQLVLLRMVTHGGGRGAGYRGGSGGDGDGENENTTSRAGHQQLGSPLDKVDEYRDSLSDSIMANLADSEVVERGFADLPNDKTALLVGRRYQIHLHDGR